MFPGAFLIECECGQTFLLGEHWLDELIVHGGNYPLYHYVDDSGRKWR